MRAKLSKFFIVHQHIKLGFWQVFRDGGIELAIWSRQAIATVVGQHFMWLQHHPIKALGAQAFHGIPINALDAHGLQYPPRYCTGNLCYLFTKQ